METNVRHHAEEFLRSEDSKRMWKADMKREAASLEARQEDSQTSCGKKPPCSLNARTW